MAIRYTHTSHPLHTPFETMDGTVSIPIEALMATRDEIGTLLDSYFEILRAQLIRDWEANRGLLVEVVTPVSEEGQ